MFWFLTLLTCFDVSSLINTSIWTLVRGSRFLMEPLGAKVKSLIHHFCSTFRFSLNEPINKQTAVKSDDFAQKTRTMVSRPDGVFLWSRWNLLVHQETWRSSSWKKTDSQKERSHRFNFIHSFRTTALFFSVTLEIKVSTSFHGAILIADTRGRQSDTKCVREFLPNLLMIQMLILLFWTSIAGLQSLIIEFRFHLIYIHLFTINTKIHKLSKQKQLRRNWVWGHVCINKTKHLKCATKTFMRPFFKAAGAYPSHSCM